jgi:hypothetical protein
MSSRAKVSRTEPENSGSPSRQSALPDSGQLSQHTTPSAIIQLARRAPGSLTPGALLKLQRTIGNRAVGQLLNTIQRAPDQDILANNKQGQEGLANMAQTLYDAAGFQLQGRAGRIVYVKTGELEQAKEDIKLYMGINLPDNFGRQGGPQIRTLLPPGIKAEGWESRVTIRAFGSQPGIECTIEMHFSSGGAVAGQIVEFKYEVPYYLGHLLG